MQKLTAVPVEVCQARAPVLLPRAKCVQEKFMALLSTFAPCHSLYNATKVLTDRDICTLGRLMRGCHVLVWVVVN